jgi:catechol 2,3-dioxygenase-like lactoylglutathione lyase family enzyme
MEISRVIIFTHDVQRLSDFYKRYFGLEVVGEADAEWAELSSGTCNIAFHRYSEEVDGRDGWVKVVFGSRNVADEKARLEDLGLSLSEVVEFGSIQLCDGQDPDGNRFQISSRGY